jgi:hypothetical protein
MGLHERAWVFWYHLARRCMRDVPLIRTVLCETIERMDPKLQGSLRTRCRLEGVLYLLVSLERAFT